MGIPTMASFMVCWWSSSFLCRSSVSSARSPRGREKPGANPLLLGSDVSPAVFVEARSTLRTCAHLSINFYAAMRHRAH